MNNREKLLENYVRLSGISFHNNVAFAYEVSGELEENSTDYVVRPYSKQENRILCIKL